MVFNNILWYLDWELVIFKEIIDVKLFKVKV